MVIRTYQDLQIFKKRRELLKAQCPPDSVFILFSGEEGHLSAFRPDSSFLYLTGFEEPNACAVIRTGAENSFTLFVRPRDQAMELWDGERFGPQGAIKVYGADQAYNIDQLSSKLPELLRGSQALYYALGSQSELDSLILDARKKAQALDRRSGRPLVPIFDPLSILAVLRVIKDPFEKEWMKENCAIAARAHVYTMQQIQVGQTEKQIQGHLLNGFLAENAVGEAYPSIVASGPNATVLHYRANNRRTEKNDLILIDAACEKYYYKSDITRTYPVSGRFTHSQKELYQAVLQIQKELIDLVKPGFSMAELQDKTVQLITQALIDLGLLKGQRSQLIKNKSYIDYYAHGVGHFLGLDVHDVGYYKIKDQPRPFQAGMVITVEPGIYIAPGNKNAPKEFRGLGVRIEDDVWIGRKGPEVLTSEVPKEIDEIENLVGTT